MPRRTRAREHPAPRFRPECGGTALRPGYDGAARFVILQLALTLALTATAANAPAANPLGTKVEAGKPAPSPKAAPSVPAARAAAEPSVTESCDGTRAEVSGDARQLKCHRWKVAWREGGTVWGYVSGDSYDAVIAERERQLGFARQYARFFEQPFDERYGDPSEPICDTCEPQKPVGRWGEGQKFGASTARAAIEKAETDLNALDKSLAEHLPRLREIAGLARETGVDKAAKAHASSIRMGMLDLAKARLALDNAAIFRSAKSAKTVSKTAAARTKDLAVSYAALLQAVGKEVSKAHGGKFLEDNTQGPQRPYLDVEFEGSKVKATYVVGAARSTWFEGEIALDGGITGQSLVAPQGGELTCPEHSEACGFVYVPAVLRFSERQAPDQKVSEAAELWFQQAKWVLAKPFSR